MTAEIRKKPKAYALVQPFEGRISYLLAGLSHFYELEVYYLTSKRFRFKWQMFYKNQYAKDVKFFHCGGMEEILGLQKTYDAGFFQVEVFHTFFARFECNDETLGFFRKIRGRFRQIFWLELGEQQWFQFGREEFWDLIDYCIKGQVFKKEYSHLLKDIQKVGLFQPPGHVNYANMVKENLAFDMEKYRGKILPFPFTPSIAQTKDLRGLAQQKIYDISANTRTYGQGALRFAILKMILAKLPKNFVYAFDFDDQGMSTNLPKALQPFDLYLKFGQLGKLLFKLKYGQYFYPSPRYVHNLSRSKCYLGLGWTFSSFRTADAWGAGTVLINFSFEKCDYGIPVEDGYNYISIGERNEMTDDNIHFKPQFADAIMSKVQAILSDSQKQKQIIQNGYKTYEEYFSSPKQFAKKIIIEKINY